MRTRKLHAVYEARSQLNFEIAPVVFELVQEFLKRVAELRALYKPG
jgi:hypothetical protein